MTPSAGPDAIHPWLLALFLAFYAGERLWELWISTRHIRALKAQGGVEHGRSHFPFIVALHTLFPLALVAEVVGLRTQPGRWGALWFGLWIATQVLRFAVVRALGPYWNTRVVVVPGMELVRHGPYRYMRHPNYAAVVGELIAAPLMFGAWRTAVVFSIANAILLRIRMGVENRALDEASSHVRDQSL